MCHQHWLHPSHSLPHSHCSPFSTQFPASPSTCCCLTCYGDCCRSVWGYRALLPIVAEFQKWSSKECFAHCWPPFCDSRNSVLLLQTLLCNSPILHMIGLQHSYFSLLEFRNMVIGTFAYSAQNLLSIESCCQTL